MRDIILLFLLSMDSLLLQLGSTCYYYDILYYYNIIT